MSRFTTAAFSPILLTERLLPPSPGGQTQRQAIEPLRTGETAPPRPNAPSTTNRQAVPASASGFRAPDRDPPPSADAGAGAGTDTYVPTRPASGAKHPSFWVVR